MITFSGVTVKFGDFTALPDLDLDIDEGEFFTLLGPSGSGKTTALRTLAGFNLPVSGTVSVNGRDITRELPEKRGIGMVFQNYALYPTMNVFENIAFGLRVKKLKGAEVTRKVDAVAERVGLGGDQLGNSVAALSGGQQQRVAIARALVLEPEILLLDEPLSNLDAKLRVRLRRQLKDLQSSLGITTVYVTHDQDEALTMSDRIAVFNHGRVEQVGTPLEVYDASATEFVSSFIGDRSIINPALLQQLGAAGLVDPARPAVLRVDKPMLLTDSDDDRGIPGVVASQSYHGRHTEYVVRVADSDVRLLQKADGRPGAAVGTGVRVLIDPRFLRQYDEAPHAGDES